MILFQLALRNLLGAGLRTWLNVIVLSVAFVAIILMQGLNEGLRGQISNSLIDFEYGGGQFWQANFDPYDPLSLSDAHANIPVELQTLIDQGKALAILSTQATIYPQERVQPIILNGIDPDQAILDIPSRYLKSEENELVALIGGRMAQSANLRIDDFVTLRWRDAAGTFDARDVRIVQIMETDVQSIDNGKVWIPLNTMQQMMAVGDEATLIVLGKSVQPPGEISGWQFKSLDFLLKDINDLIRMRMYGSAVFYLIILLIAMLAVVDTQILSIFRRKKEIGTLIALGMTRATVVKLFTLEGFLYGVFAAAVAAIYGTPLFTYLSSNGIPIPQSSESMGLALGQVLYPAYSAALILGTTVIVLITVLIVSFLPTRRIAKLKPADALRGRLA